MDYSAEGVRGQAVFSALSPSVTAVQKQPQAQKQRGTTVFKNKEFAKMGEKAEFGRRALEGQSLQDGGENEQPPLTANDTDEAHDAGQRKSDPTGHRARPWLFTLSTGIGSPGSRALEVRAEVTSSRVRLEVGRGRLLRRRFFSGPLVTSVFGFWKFIKVHSYGMCTFWVYINGFAMKKVFKQKV